MNDKIYELHKALVQKIIDYCMENDIDNASEFYLNIDGLNHSVDEGSWHPGTDSCMELYNSDGERILYSI